MCPKQKYSKPFTETPAGLNSGNPDRTTGSWIITKLAKDELLPDCGLSVNKFLKGDWRTYSAGSKEFARSNGYFEFRVFDINTIKQYKMNGKLIETFTRDGNKLSNED